MILSDRSIRVALRAGEIVIDPPPADQCIQPASVDLLLGAEFQSPYEDRPRHYPKGCYLAAGECILATTVEYIQVPNWLVGRVEGKSSWGRKFMLAHATAGFIDPGFRGTITLELVNLSRVSQVLPVGMPIAQISFMQLTTEAERPYGHPELKSNYQNQFGVRPSALSWT